MKAANEHIEQLGNRENILFSLHYLAMEAKKMGYNELYNIIQTAIRIAMSADPDEIEHSCDFAFDDDEDFQVVFEFLLLFAKAMPDTKKEIVSVMELMEFSEMDVQNGYNA